MDASRAFLDHAPLNTLTWCPPPPMPGCVTTPPPPPVVSWGRGKPLIVAAKQARKYSARFESAGTLSIPLYMAHKRAKRRGGADGELDAMRSQWRAWALSCCAPRLPFRNRSASSMQLTASPLCALERRYSMLTNWGGGWGWDVCVGAGLDVESAQGTAARAQSLALSMCTRGDGRAAHVDEQYAIKFLSFADPHSFLFPHHGNSTMRSTIAAVHPPPPTTHHFNSSGAVESVLQSTQFVGLDSNRPRRRA